MTLAPGSRLKSVGNTLMDLPIGALIPSDTDFCEAFWERPTGPPGDVVISSYYPCRICWVPLRSAGQIARHVILIDEAPYAAVTIDFCVSADLVLTTRYNVVTDSVLKLPAGVEMTNSDVDRWPEAADVATTTPTASPGPANTPAPNTAFNGWPSHIQPHYDSTSSLDPFLIVNGVHLLRYIDPRRLPPAWSDGKAKEPWRDQKRPLRERAQHFLRFYLAAVCARTEWLVVIPPADASAYSGHRLAVKGEKQRMLDMTYGSLTEKHRLQIGEMCDLPEYTDIPAGTCVAPAYFEYPVQGLPGSGLDKGAWAMHIWIPVAFTRRHEAHPRLLTMLINGTPYARCVWHITVRETSKNDDGFSGSVSWDAYDCLETVRPPIAHILGTDDGGFQLQPVSEWIHDVDPAPLCTCTHPDCPFCIESLQITALAKQLAKVTSGKSIMPSAQVHELLSGCVKICLNVYAPHVSVRERGLILRKITSNAERSMYLAPKEEHSVTFTRGSLLYFVIAPLLPIAGGFDPSLHGRDRYERLFEELFDPADMIVDRSREMGAAVSAAEAEFGDVVLRSSKWPQPIKLDDILAAGILRFVALWKAPVRNIEGLGTETTSFHRLLTQKQAQLHSHMRGRIKLLDNVSSVSAAEAAAEAAANQLLAELELEAASGDAKHGKSNSGAESSSSGGNAGKKKDRQKTSSSGSRAAAPPAPVTPASSSSTAASSPSAPAAAIGNPADTSASKAAAASSASKKSDAADKGAARAIVVPQPKGTSAATATVLQSSAGHASDNAASTPAAVSAAGAAQESWIDVSKKGKGKASAPVSMATSSPNSNEASSATSAIVSTAAAPVQAGKAAASAVASIGPTPSPAKPPAAVAGAGVSQTSAASVSARSAASAAAPDAAAAPVPTATATPKRQTGNTWAARASSSTAPVTGSNNVGSAVANAPSSSAPLGANSPATAPHVVAAVRVSADVAFPALATSLPASTISASMAAQNHSGIGIGSKPLTATSKKQQKKIEKAAERSKTLAVTGAGSTATASVVVDQAAFPTLASDLVPAPVEPVDARIELSSPNAPAPASVSTWEQLGSASLHLGSLSSEAAAPMSKSGIAAASALHSGGDSVLDRSNQFAAASPEVKSVWNTAAASRSAPPTSLAAAIAQRKQSSSSRPAPFKAEPGSAWAAPASAPQAHQQQQQQHHEGANWDSEWKLLEQEVFDAGDEDTHNVNVGVIGDIAGEDVLLESLGMIGDEAEQDADGDTSTATVGNARARTDSMSAGLAQPSPASRVLSILGYDRSPSSITPTKLFNGSSPSTSPVRQVSVGSVASAFSGSRFHEAEAWHSEPAGPVSVISSASPTTTLQGGAAHFTRSSTPTPSTPTSIAASGSASGAATTLDLDEGGADLESPALVHQLQAVLARAEAAEQRARTMETVNHSLWQEFQTAKARAEFAESRAQDAESKLAALVMEEMIARVEQSSAAADAAALLTRPSSSSAAVAAASLPSGTPAATSSQSNPNAPPVVPAHIAPKPTIVRVVKTVHPASSAVSSPASAAVNAPGHGAAALGGAGTAQPSARPAAVPATVMRASTVTLVENLRSPSSSPSAQASAPSMSSARISASASPSKVSSMGASSWSASSAAIVSASAAAPTAARSASISSAIASSVHVPLIPAAPRRVGVGAYGSSSASGSGHGHGSSRQAGYGSAAGSLSPLKQPQQLSYSASGVATHHITSSPTKPSAMSMLAASATGSPGGASSSSRKLAASPSPSAVLPLSARSLTGGGISRLGSATSSGAASMATASPARSAGLQSRSLALAGGAATGLSSSPPSSSGAGAAGAGKPRARIATNDGSGWDTSY